jgi:hypothetical protein
VIPAVYFSQGKDNRRPFSWIGAPEKIQNFLPCHQRRLPFHEAGCQDRAEVMDMEVHAEQFDFHEVAHDAVLAAEKGRVAVHHHHESCFVFYHAPYASLKVSNLSVFWQIFSTYRFMQAQCLNTSRIGDHYLIEI